MSTKFGSVFGFLRLYYNITKIFCRSNGQTNKHEPNNHENDSLKLTFEAVRFYWITFFAQRMRRHNIKLHQKFKQMCLLSDASSGSLCFPDGSTYSGELANGMKHGKGVQTLANGSKYDGEWKNDKKDGQGVEAEWYGAKYDGQWKDNKKDGRGVETWPVGRKYDGQ